MEKKRSVGVVLSGILFLGIGVIDFPNILMRGITYYEITNQMDFIEFLYNIFTTISLIIAGIGILSLKKWARYLTILLALLFICSNVMHIVNYSSLSAQAQAEQLFGIFFYIAILINIIILIFFTRHKVKEQFR